MSYYTDDDLRDFSKYAAVKLKDAKDTPAPEKIPLEYLIRLLTSMYHNAMVFESYIEGSTAQVYLLAEDLHQLPLHMNDDGLLSQVIVRWRLERNK